MRRPILAVSGHAGQRVRFDEAQDIAAVHRKPWVDDILMSLVVRLVGARQVRVPAVISPVGDPAPLASQAGRPPDRFALMLDSAAVLPVTPAPLPDP